MNAKTIGWVLLTLPLAAVSLSAQSKPSVYDLVGHWESTVEFGKFKFDLTIKVAKLPDGRIDAKVDIPDQGANDVPVSAVLFNYPAVRWEIDPFNTAFNGKVNEAGTEIAGAFEEGPGGRPVALTFKRADPSKRIEPKRTYAFEPGESRDIRGYWEGVAEPGTDNQSRLGLRVGRAPDGSFAAVLDLLDQGARDVRATSVEWTNATAKLEWRLFQLEFQGKLDEAGQEWVGDWKSRGKKSPVRFRRLEAPATAVPANVSFTPDPGAPEDVRGDWAGTLAVRGEKLRLLVKIGRKPDGTFAGTLASPDQGPGEVPFSSFGYTNPVVRIEWKGIRGVFTGKLNPEGTLMDGTWEQVGPGLPLKLARAPAEAKQP